MHKQKVIINQGEKINVPKGRIFFWWVRKKAQNHAVEIIQEQPLPGTNDVRKTTRNVTSVMRQATKTRRRVTAKRVKPH